MQDYQGNANKDKAKKIQPKEEKSVQKVVSGEVVVQKKSLGRKFKDVFIEADFRSVVHYVATEVLLPAARNMIVDASSKGVERMMYGESSSRRRGITHGGPRVTYNNPISRGYSDTSPRRAPLQRPGAGTSRRTQDDYILATREDADFVLERMQDIVENYEVVSVADLNELVGYPSGHVDNKWGWFDLRTASVRQVRDGFLLDLPPADPVS